MKTTGNQGTFVEVARQHQAKIARRTLTLTCVGARIFGGMDHVDAARLLGQALPAGCDCRERRG